MILQRSAVLFLALAMILTGVSLFPNDAEALGLEVGVNAKGGAGSYSTGKTGDDEPPLGYGAGGQIFGLVKVPIQIPLSIGLNFDYSYFGHSEEINGVTRETTVTLPSVGLMIRGGGANKMVNKKLAAASGAGWGGQAWLNYTFGSVASQILQSNGQTLSNPDTDFTGYQLGGQAFYSMQMKPYKTFIEPGVFVTYSGISTETGSNTVDGTTTITKDDATYFTVGLVLQVTFGIGK